MLCHLLICIWVHHAAQLGLLTAPPIVCTVHPCAESLTAETVGFHLERTDFGVQQLAVLAVVSYILLDAAERVELGNSTIRTLNISAGVCVAAISLITVQV